MKHSKSRQIHNFPLCPLRGSSIPRYTVTTVCQAGPTAGGHKKSSKNYKYLAGARSSTRLHVHEENLGALS